jgi:hypothetical protein
MRPSAWIIADKISLQTWVCFDESEMMEIKALNQDNIVPVFSETDVMVILEDFAWTTRKAVLDNEINESSCMNEFVENYMKNKD